VAGLTPLECFLAGVAFASTGAAVFLFFLLRSVAALRQQTPVSPVKAGTGASPGDQGAAALHQRLEQVEARLSALERRLRGQPMTAATGPAAITDQVRE
jgi:hypothetical protein